MILSALFNFGLSRLYQIGNLEWSATLVLHIPRLV